MKSIGKLVLVSIVLLNLTACVAVVVVGSNNKQVISDVDSDGSLQKIKRK